MIVTWYSVTLQHHVLKSDNMVMCYIMRTCVRSRSRTFVVRRIVLFALPIDGVHPIDTPVQELRD